MEETVQSTSEPPVVPETILWMDDRSVRWPTAATPPWECDRPTINATAVSPDPYYGNTYSTQSPLPLNPVAAIGASDRWPFEQPEEDGGGGGEDGRPRAQQVITAEPNAQEAWLPITRSREGNTRFAVFHLLSSGIGMQSLILPLAFSALGWTWGILCLTFGFAWQFYTLWLLVQLHESPSGVRCSRYLGLCIAAFGKKRGKLLGIFPVMYLSGGTCANLIIGGGTAVRSFFSTVCHKSSDGSSSCADRLTGVEWFLVFTCAAILLAQLLPHLNSVAWVSLIGAVTAIGYCTLIWAVPVGKGKPSAKVDAQSVVEHSQIGKVRDALNALGIIALSFRGHNAVLEIQGTLPSRQRPRDSMWRAAVISYILIAICFYPLAIGGYWTYGDTIQVRGGIPTSAAMLNNFSQSYGDEISKWFMAFILLLVVVNCLTLFQIYAMFVFDNVEFQITAKRKKPCPPWLSRVLRVLLGGLLLLVASAFPFLGSLGPLVGGLTSPLTFAYPCFMWNAIKKPRRKGAAWSINLGLGCLGVLLCFVLVAAAIWNLVDKGLEANFFKPSLRPVKKWDDSE